MQMVFLHVFCVKMNELCDDIKGYILGFLSPRSAASAARAHRGLRMREEDARLAMQDQRLQPLFLIAAGTTNSRNSSMRPTPALCLAIARGQDTAARHAFTPARTWAALTQALARARALALAQALAQAPPRVLTILHVAQVATYGRRLLMRTQTGCAYSLGTGVHGQLGLGPGITHAAAPMRIAFMQQPVTRVATCETHSAFVCADGSLFTCGLDEDGQLGQGHTYPPPPPQQQQHHHLAENDFFDFGNDDDDEDYIYAHHDDDDDDTSDTSDNSDEWIVDDEKVHMTPEPARVRRVGTDRLDRGRPVLFMEVAINRSMTVALAADGQVYMCGYVPVAAQHHTWTKLRAHPRFRALSKRAVCVRAFSNTNDVEFDDVAVLTVKNEVYSTTNARSREHGDTVPLHPRLEALGATWGTGVVGSLVVPVTMSVPRLSVLQRALARQEHLTDFSLVSRAAREEQ